MQLELVNGESGSHHTVIQVIGIGGGGSNAVHRMIEQGLEGVQFIMANTDLQALECHSSPVASKIPLGEKITGGLGAGGDPEVGREAAEEDLEKIKELIKEAHMVFVTAGMGGGTGTGAAPVVARIAKEMGKLCVGIVTTPFHFEGQRKFQLALKGVEELREEVDTLIIIPNQLLLQVLETGTSVREAFRNADEVLRQGVKGIADLITQPGDINVDFNDVCTVMRDGGQALMGIGISTGEDRAMQATVQALQNPLLSGEKMAGATGILVQITADESFTLEEYSCIMNEINAYVDAENATVISGIAIDDQKKDEIKVTVIATGFSDDNNLQQKKQHGYSRRSTSSNFVETREQGGFRTTIQDSSRATASTAPSMLQGTRQRVLEGVGASGVPHATPHVSPPRANAQISQAAEARSPMRENPLEVSLSTPLQDYGASSSAPSAQAVQMQEALEGSAVGLAEASEEEQVTNKELQLLFKEKKPQNSERRMFHFGQKRTEPQMPPSQSEDLYVPALLRRKQRKH